MVAYRSPQFSSSRLHFRSQLCRRSHRPFVYQGTATNQVHVYSVDLSTGYFLEATGSPFTAPGFGLPIAFSVAPGSSQPIVGPVATITPGNLFFGSSTVGIAAPTQSLMLSSTGDQALSVNAVSITGLNASDFSQIDNCNAPTVLKPTTSCLITVTFTPTGSGSRLGQFTVTDNAPGSPQSVPLTGTGLGAPPPAPGDHLYTRHVDFFCPVTGVNEFAAQRDPH